MKTINLREWNVTYDELVAWANENGADVYALVHHGGNGVSATYGFEKDEDLLAFKLKFSREQTTSISFYTNGACRLTI